VDVIFNGGKLRNYGFESALGLTPIASPKFTWVSRTSFFLNRSEVTELDVPAFEADAGFALFLGGFFIEEGSSLTQIVGTDPDCTGAGTPHEGCRSLAGHAKIGNSDPDFNMGFTNSFNLGGNLELFTLFEWRYGQEVINLTELLYDDALNSEDFGSVDQFFTLLDDPTYDASDCHPDCNGAQRLAGFANGWSQSYTQPASFLKAREISLSYTLPESFTASFLGGLFSRARVRASARNLFTITNYNGLDPEVSNFGSQQVGRAIDVAPFPPSRSLWLGIDFNL
jgi:hypothetical protein